MKIKEGFVLRTVLGQSVIVAEGSKTANFDKIIALNSSAALLWESVAHRQFGCDDLAQILVEKYGIDPERAQADAAEIAEKWRENGLVDD